MKEQKLISVGLHSPRKAEEDYEWGKESPFIPMDLPLENYFSDGWQIVSYQLVGESHFGNCYAVVLLEREAK